MGRSDGDRETTFEFPFSNTVDVVSWPRRQDGGPSDGEAETTLEVSSEKRRSEVGIVQ